MEASNLALFWAGVLAVAIMAYVILDGFDLGVGVLFGTTSDNAQRATMMHAIAPFWDGNETWLVIIGAGLFAAFPVVYGVFLGAFYIPVLLLLVGLIFRGIAFEFRDRASGMRVFWDYGFFIGSIVIAFVQGAAVGAMIEGIPVVNNQYAGGSFGWLRPFPVLTGIGLVLGYALLGAGWLVVKCDGDVRDWAYRRIPWLTAGVLVVLGVAFALVLNKDALAHSNLHSRQWGFAFPVIGMLALLAVIAGARKRRDHVPFAMTALFFLAAYVTLGIMFWPFMIPYTITVANAAAPEASLSFLFYGAGLFALPIVVIYTIGVYWIFRGKGHKGYG